MTKPVAGLFAKLSADPPPPNTQERICGLSMAGVTISKDMPVEEVAFGVKKLLVQAIIDNADVNTSDVIEKARGRSDHSRSCCPSSVGSGTWTHWVL
jgi:translation elongation factor EF-1beta